MGCDQIIDMRCEIYSKPLTLSQFYRYLVAGLHQTKLSQLSESYQSYHRYIAAVLPAYIKRISRRVLIVTLRNTGLYGGLIILVAKYWTIFHSEIAMME